MNLTVASPHLDESESDEHEPSIFDALSQKEKMVLKKLLQPTKEIAMDLYLGQSTVRTHLHMICKKTGIADAETLAIKAAHYGFLSIDDIPLGLTAGLTDRELCVLQSHYKDTARQAAASLNVSVSSVRGYWTNIYSKTGATTRFQAIMMAVKDGLIPLN